MAFGHLLLLHFKVTESYNDIKLKNHKRSHNYKSIASLCSVRSAHKFHTIFDPVDKYFLLKYARGSYWLGKTHNPIKKNSYKRKSNSRSAAVSKQKLT